MKRIFIVSQALLFFNICILAVPTFFYLVPNLDLSENGVGGYQLMCMIYGLYGLFITVPLAFIVFIVYMIYKYKKR